MNSHAHNLLAIYLCYSITYPYYLSQRFRIMSDLLLSTVNLLGQTLDDLVYHREGP